MPSIFSSHDVSIRVDTKKTRIVPHVSQRHRWDCGFACVAMVASYVHPKSYPPLRAYEETMACAAAVLPQQLVKRLPTFCEASSDNDVGGSTINSHDVDGIDDRKQEEAVVDGARLGPSRCPPSPVTIECNGVWTIHLALVLRAMVDTPRNWFHSVASGAVPQKPKSREDDVVEMEPVTVPREAESTSAEVALAPRPSERQRDRPVENAELVAAVSLFTTCVGVNPEYQQAAGMTFYENVDDVERSLVIDAFERAAQCGVQVQELLLSTRDIAELLSEQVDGDQDELLFICLVDARKLQCPCRLAQRPPPTWTQLAWSTLGYSDGNDDVTSREFVGHYVVVCGYDAVTDQVLYRDPSTSGDESPPGSGYLCAQSVTAFEHARCARGTDHDVIMAKIC